MVRGTSERALFPYKLKNGRLLGSSGLKSLVVYLSIPLRHELVLTLGGGGPSATEFGTSMFLRSYRLKNLFMANKTRKGSECRISL